MRTTFLGLAAALGVAAGFFAGRASADPYKYCAIYSGGRGGGGTISGVGGTCTFNPYYDGVSFDGATPVRRHKRHPS